jgi:hypothetical protein
MVQGGKRGRFVAFGFFLKEIGLIAVLWMALYKLGSHPVGFLIGFSVPLVVGLIYGIFEGFNKA